MRCNSDEKLRVFRLPPRPLCLPPVESTAEESSLLCWAGGHLPLWQSRSWPHSENLSECQISLSLDLHLQKEVNMASFQVDFLNRELSAVSLFRTLIFLTDLPFKSAELVN